MKISSRTREEDAPSMRTVTSARRCAPYNDVSFTNLSAQMRANAMTGSGLGRDRGAMPNRCHALCQVRHISGHRYQPQLISSFAWDRL